MRALLFSIGVLLSSVAADAAPTDSFYLQIPGITGETTANKFQGWIQVSTFSAGITTPTDVSSGGSASGKPQCKPLTVVKPLDTTSPELAKDAALGTHLSTVVLAAASSAGGEQREFLRFTLKNARISSVLFGGDSAASSRTETVTITAETVEITAYPNRLDGSGGQPVTMQFSCVANTVS